VYRDEEPSLPILRRPQVFDCVPNDGVGGQSKNSETVEDNVNGCAEISEYSNIVT
jgi:hypothetical protein